MRVTPAAGLRKLPYLGHPPSAQSYCIRAFGDVNDNSLTQFDDLGLAEPILRALQTEGYTTPTPIQEGIIPTMVQGGDVVGIAQTGTGKTAAFVLPLLQRISKSKSKLHSKSCRYLVLAPTRELAAQIDKQVRAYGRFLKLKTTIVVGGVKPGPQIRALKPGVDIVIATPGRLEDHLSTGAVGLDQVETVVLDEADQMLDLGFLPAIRRLMAKLPKDRQTVLLSATMPKQIRKLANDFLTDPCEVSVAPAAKPIDRIDQHMMLVASADKRTALLETVGVSDVDRAIVFTRTKRGADRVCQHLLKAGHKAAAIHGNRSQGQRERALADFKKGRIKVLVATDIAARGIDIDDISHVINYELPNVPEAYVHRIGRTARAGKSGIAVSFCDPAERKQLRDIERLIGRSLLSDEDRKALEAASVPPTPQRKKRVRVQVKPWHGRGDGSRKPKRASRKSTARKSSTKRNPQKHRNASSRRDRVPA